MRTLVFAAVLAATSYAQDTDRVTVPLSRPGQPATLQINLMQGEITVRGYEGSEIAVEGRGKSGRPGRVPKKAEGLRRVEVGGTGMRIDENDNVVQISAPPGSEDSVTVQVPRNTTVKVNSLNGDIVVEGVAAEVSAKSNNGGITIRNVSGAVTANTMNGDLIVTFNRVAEGQPMAFSSYNGDVDVTLPATVKANVRVKAGHGDLFTDFDIKMDPSRGPTVSDRSEGKGRRVAFDRSVSGSINGGGPEYQFTTFNGQVYIRRAK